MRYIASNGWAPRRHAGPARARSRGSTRRSGIEPRRAELGADASAGRRSRRRKVQEAVAAAADARRDGHERRGVRAPLSTASSSATAARRASCAAASSCIRSCASRCDSRTAGRSSTRAEQVVGARGETSNVAMLLEVAPAQRLARADGARRSSARPDSRKCAASARASTGSTPTSARTKASPTTAASQMHAALIRVGQPDVSRRRPRAGGRIRRGRRARSIDADPVVPAAVARAKPIACSRIASSSTPRAPATPGSRSRSVAAAASSRRRSRS